VVKQADGHVRDGCGAILNAAPYSEGRINSNSCENYRKIRKICNSYRLYMYTVYRESKKNGATIHSLITLTNVD